MNLRKILRIARWEIKQGGGIATKENIVFAVVVLALTSGVLYASGGLAAESNIYQVGVSQDSPYHPAIEQSTPLQPVPPNETAFQNGEIPLLIDDGRILTRDTDKGRAAASELQTAVDRYNYKLMLSEKDKAAAFPVKVNVSYLKPQSIKGGGVPAPGSSNENTSPEGKSQESTDSDTTSETETSDETDNSSTNESQTSGSANNSSTSTNTSTTETEEASDNDTETNNTSTSDTQTTTETDEDNDSILSSLNQAQDGKSNGPDSLTPPFPFESLLLAFAYILPLNFIVQMYASSIIDERLNNRGELMLVSPVSKHDIVLGKTLPYFVLATLICGAITWNIGGGGASLLAVMSLVVVFLASGFISALYARSYKELTFVTLTASVFLTAYAFLPAVFTTVHPISIISPLYVIVSELRGNSIQLASFLLSTTPLFLVGGLMFAIGSGIYTEEGLFTQRRVELKLLDSLAAQQHSKWSFFLLGAISLPFVFAAELLVLTALVLFPSVMSLPILLALIALIEESAKSLPAYAGFATGRWKPTRKLALAAGALSGAGFFIAEKMTMVAQGTGIGTLDLGQALLGTTSTTGGLESTVGIVLLVLWPFLHSLTAMVGSYGARHGRLGYALSVLAATFIHLMYNLTAVVIYA